MTTVKLTSPAARASLSSPLAIVCVRYSDATERAATLEVGGVVHVVELTAGSGEFRENVTLLQGKNRIRVTIGGASDERMVSLKRSRYVKIKSPAERKDKVPTIKTRAMEIAGTFKNAACPAGVIAVNGFMQQFAVQGKSGGFAEKVVLRPGDNHLAVQIGEFYATRLVRGTFKPAKVLATLVWDTNNTDVDLYVIDPKLRAVWYGNLSVPRGGKLDVDRTQGFGPENYSLGLAGGKVMAGEYRVRVHYYADRGIGRTEWTVRLITDESTPAQQRKNYYGILDHSNSSNSKATGSGKDWDDVCTLTVSWNGQITIKP